MRNYEMKNVENDLEYLEGKWVGNKVTLFIENTIYGTIDNAITIKKVLVEKFEKEIGYSRIMNVEKFDRNYAYNLGFLDALVEFKNNKDGIQG